MPHTGSEACGAKGLTPQGPDSAQAAAHLKRWVSPADQQTLRTAAQCARYSEQDDPGIGAGYLKSRSLLEAHARM